MSDQDKKKKVLSRRDFLKTIGAAGVATTGLTACAGGGKGGTIDSIRNPCRPDDLPD